MNHGPETFEVEARKIAAGVNWEFGALTRGPGGMERETPLTRRSRSSTCLKPLA
jgi:hypothetical protein